MIKFLLVLTLIVPMQTASGHKTDQCHHHIEEIPLSVKIIAVGAFALTATPIIILLAREPQILRQIFRNSTK